MLTKKGETLNQGERDILERAIRLSNLIAAILRLLI